MARHYSPIDGAELGTHALLYPRTAFLMIHDNDRVSAIEANMQRMVRASLQKTGFSAVSATDVSGSGDFLQKIIRLIQGCGFGIAVFSDATPSRTLANIFFEIGYCLALGKPTQLILAGDQSAPSDFVRTEWIKFEGNDDAFQQRLDAYLASVVDYGDYLLHLAIAAEEAEEMDPELAFERFRRAYLVSGQASALDGVRRIQKLLRNVSEPAKVGAIMKANRRSLSDEVTSFLRLADKAGLA